MFNKRAVLFSFLISLLASIVNAQFFFDRGYEFGGGFGFRCTPGFGIIAGLCDNYGEFFEFFVLFAIFYVVGHWTFKGRGKSDVLAVVIAFALAIGIVRAQSFSGYSLVCGLGDIFGGLFGGFLGIILLLIIIFGFFAIARGGNGAKAGVGVAYILFYFWLGSEGGYLFSDLFYYLPLDPFFAQSVLNLLLAVAFFFVVVFGYRWFKGEP